MENHYRLTISSRNLYKEIELSSDIKALRIGTSLDCDIRLRKDLFFESVELYLVNNNDVWSVFCSDNLYLNSGDVRKLITKNLVHGDTFEVKYQNSDSSVFNIEFLIDFNKGNKKYERSMDISNSSKITLGCGVTNDIVFRSNYTKNDSVSLERSSKGFVLNIYQSTYGVYINGKRAERSSVLKNGDFFSIADFFFYLKNDRIWTEIRADLIVNNLRYDDKPLHKSYPKFNRNTRIKTKLNDEKIEILDPPEKPKKPKSNLFMKLLPSLGMLLASVVMASFGSKMIAFSLISGVMAIFTTIMGIIDGKKEYEKSVSGRSEQYNSYINNKTQEIEKYRNEEKSSLEEIYISQNEEYRRLETFSPDLFDRTKTDDDFLCVRLGSGTIEAHQEINFKKQEKLSIEDELQLKPEELYNRYKYINDAPVVCDLKKCNSVGIVGNEKQRYQMFKNMVIDIAARQYQSDVKIVIVANEKHKKDIFWLRMLPHLYISNPDLRLLVCNGESKNFIFEYLYSEFTRREQCKHFDSNFVVFLYDDFGIKSHPISKFINKAKDIGVTFVFFGAEKSNVPIGASRIINIVDESKAQLIDVDDRNKSVDFSYSCISEDQAREIIQILAPVYTEEISLEGSLTKNYSLFEMLDILSVDDLDLTARWNSSQVFKSMSAPIGISKTGTVCLDLHDKAHGPHGLVAGTTGSGKSEILQTYILAMATLYHPHEVGFVIIDFKGGGMANQFKNLPHLLGTITNIDGKEIERSLKSIKAELQKRQRYFAEADVNHIDKYIRKYKSGEVKVALPHLIIIVDEFAELKAEQPEFMKELISAARIGRSLGVHLILATQKPSGQVNEQIWSNSRFKLCLKVQSQEDSNEVLKAPLASEIKEPGRAYLQVGNNEIFELFQSAYSGAPEKTDDTNVNEYCISSYNDSGKSMPIFVQKKKNSGEGVQNQLEATVQFVAKHCIENNLKKLSDICLPSLKDYLNIPNDFANYDLMTLPLGIYDDPDSQYQGYAKFDLCTDNTIIIGASQTGKTNFLQNIIKLVANKYSPEDAVFYIVDFGSMYLKNFEKLNHVGGVVTVSESEKFKNLFKLLIEEISKRKSKFLECGISSFAAYRDAGFSDLPHIFLMIDNFSAYKEIYSDLYEEQFSFLAREGVSYGISIIVTNLTTNGIGYKYLSSFATRFSLACNDNSEYMSLFDRCRIYPKDVTGRMICRINKETYEMQSFIAFEGEKEIDRSNEVKKFIEQINNKYCNNFAKKIPCVPDVLDLDYIESNYDTDLSLSQYPIGLDYENVDVVALDLKLWNEFYIVGKDSAKRLPTINGILSSMHANALTKPISLYIIDNFERNLSSKSELAYVEKYTNDFSYIGSILEKILIELESRNDLVIKGDFDKLSKCDHIVVLINSKDAIDYMSTNKDVLELYNNILKLKSLGITFIFSDIDECSPIGVSAVLKKLRENKKAIITSKLVDSKFSDLPSDAARKNKISNAGDVFILDGSDVKRIKMIEG